MKKKYLFIIAVLSPVILFSQNSSQWRGERRDGHYNETGLLKVWPANGPQLLWSYEGLGAGYTSVAIANGKIYVTGMTDDNLTLYVFDIKGKLLNKKVVGKERTAQYPGPRCTVVVNDGMLYIGNSVGQFYCLDEATLNEVWKKELFQDFDGRHVGWGWVESPLIVGEKIFLTPGGIKDNMVALNKKTGALIWSSPGKGTPSSYCSPMYISDQRVPIVATWMASARGGRGSPNDNELVAFNAETGDVLWSIILPSENNINPNTPIYSDGLIFASTGYSGGSWLLRLKDGGKTVEQVWHNVADNCHHGPVKVGDYVYTTAHNNSRGFYCIDWKTGETKYREANYPQSSMICADGMLYVYSDNGNMNLVKPNPDKYELVSSFKITLGTDHHWAHPVIHQGVLYIRHGDALMAYKVK